MNDIQEFLSNFKTIKTIIVFAFGILLQIGTTKSLNNIRKKFGFQKRRFIIINKIISVIVYASVIIIISFIWVDENQLIYFISSFLTILWIAFFAQWSILSNITAGLILFVNYPVKIGDEITILEKDNNITGEIKDIGAFFITLQIEDKELITVPNSIVLQRNIKFKEKLK